MMETIMEPAFATRQPHARRSLDSSHDWLAELRVAPWSPAA
jgi:hypothetical protein